LKNNKILNQSRFVVVVVVVVVDVDAPLHAECSRYLHHHHRLSISRKHQQLRDIPETGISDKENNDDRE